MIRTFLIPLIYLVHRDYLMKRAHRMKTFHFYTKHEAYTFLDVNSETFHEEEKQLFEQGFELDIKSIDAETAQEAVEKYEQENDFNCQATTTLAMIEALTIPVVLSVDD